MTFEVECPSCGQTVEGTDIERKPDDVDAPDVTIARRQTAFDGSVTSLTEMGHFAYWVRLPCGCEVLTVN
jgi:hypothetical protein